MVHHIVFALVHINTLWFHLFRHFYFANYQKKAKVTLKYMRIVMWYFVKVI